MKNIEQQTLSSIVLEHHQLIPVFEKYNLDFCCRGKRTLAEACEEKQLRLEGVVTELEVALRDTAPQQPFAEMSAEQLIGYIILHHHFYVRQSIPLIAGHIEKVVSKHGDRYPYMQIVQQLFGEVQDDLLPHMFKEEHILFPRIKEVMSDSAAAGQFPAAYINAPVALMETEHDAAGQLMFAIRELTNNYTPPQDACTTHRVCLDELRAFEDDLHRHVHLENNILFPMAVGLHEQVES